MASDIDFEGLSRALLGRIRDLLPGWLPGGKPVGHEYVCGNLRGEPGDSLKVNLNTGKWADFATGEKGGDLISLYASIQGIKNGEAARRLARELGLASGQRERRSPVRPSSAPVVAAPPPDAPAPAMVHTRHGRPSASWCYRDAGGAPIFHVARYETPGGKQIIPWSWSADESKWIPKAPPTPRPLYGLDLLAARPEAPVLVVEGEKSCDAARKIVGNRYVAVTWPGGAEAIDAADWRPVHGRRVLFHPDADAPGLKALSKFGAKHGDRLAELKYLDVAGMPDAWDLADALADGWDWDRYYTWAKPRARTNGTNAAPPTASSPPTAPADDPAINCTDLGNARRFVRKNRDVVRYCYSWERWLVWNGVIWARDESGEAARLAKDTIMTIYDEAARAPDFKLREELIKHALKSEAAGRIASMLKLAESELPIPVLQDALDRDGWLMGVPNGTLDLKTGELRASRREDFITKQAGVAYDAAAKCPTWEAFLTRILDGKDHLVTFLQRAIGYSLTGDTREQVLFFLHGHGANGKSTFLEAVRRVLGDYAQQMSMDSLAVKKNRDGSANTPDIARLHRARFVAAVESDENMRFSEGLVKQLTGNDKITACRKYEDPFEFHPSHKLFIGTNHKPVIRGTDYAIWRRIRLIPFEVTIPPEERDPALLDRLSAESAGILAWAVRGCLDWQRNGLGLPKEVEAATEEYRSEMDVLGGFIAERIIPVPGGQGRVRASDLYEAYKNWCKDTGNFQMNQTNFGRKLNERGFRKEEGRTVWYLGIQLSQQEKEEVAF